MDIRGLLVRKAFHIIGVILLATPFLAGVSENYISIYYALLALVAGVFYSIQIKRPQLLLELRADIFRSLQSMFENLERLVPVQRSDLKIQYDEIIIMIERAIEEAERDYEKRGGYLGLLMGAVGVLISYTIFGFVYLLPAIIGLAIYDTFSALVGSAFGRHRLPRAHATVEGVLGGSIPTFVALMWANYGVLGSLIITLFVVFAEAYGIEDNLTIPIAASLAAFLMARAPI
ncbi:phosphatidate cytidylyltransferase [Thermoproteus tenax]|uniref:phosphatidate cytidylyltransferase n=1 Tax=Thermoproteus tenax TaxID=2271 RepID=UPI000699BC9A|nr:phosphatidate cytidylyltransferase [Thermoproteus tenax]